MAEAEVPAPRMAVPRASLAELAWVFLRLGTLAFGGPAAHVAMMENEVVRRRRWLTDGQFLDLLGAAYLIPGPNSTELAIHIGRLRGGWPGLLVAGACFILPAALMVTAIAWAYVRFGALPQATAVLHGVSPVVIAVVVQALWGLGRSAIRSAWHACLALGALAATFLGAHELLVLGTTGAVALLARLRRGTGPSRALPALAMRAARLNVRTSGLMVAGGAAGVPFGLWPLFLVFLKVGAVLFGSGYVLLAFLRADLVERLHWLTARQLLDAVAVGQVTPGPVFTTATFVGYVLGRAPGAAVATIGIFLPAFLFVAVSGPLVPWLRRSPAAGALLDGVNAASLALMAAVTWHLARAALVDPFTILEAGLCLLLLTRYRVNSAWLVLGGAAAGLLIPRLGLGPG
jgi:chromate transporter